MKKSLFSTVVLSVISVSAFADYEYAKSYDMRRYVSAKALGLFDADASAKIIRYDHWNNKVETDVNGGISPTFGAAFALGSYFSNFDDLFRAELEFSQYAKATAKAVPDVKIGNWSVSANGYYDFLTYEKFTPYVGAGLGFNIMKVNMLAGAYEDLSLIWRIMMGVSYEIDKNIAIDVAYCYVDFGSVFHVYDDPYGGSEEWYMSGHEITIGLRWTF